MIKPTQTDRQTTNIGYNIDFKQIKYLQLYEIYTQLRILTSYMQ